MRHQGHRHGAKHAWPEFRQQFDRGAPALDLLLFGYVPAHGARIGIYRPAGKPRGKAAEVQGRRPGTSNPEAFLLAHGALFHLRKFNREDQAKARELGRRAREIAPDDLFPLQMEGWIHLADARYGWSGSREESLQKAEQIVRQSMELGGDAAGMYVLLAGIHRARRTLDRAIEFVEKTVQLNPNHGGAGGTLE